MTIDVSGSTMLDLSELNKIIACPISKKKMQLLEGEDVFAVESEHAYSWKNGNWNLLPPASVLNGKKWADWNQLQENGLVSYKQDPEHNLAVGEREDFIAFGNFCEYQGLVLDVGCGFQSWPGYFLKPQEGVKFVGIDPLINASSTQYRQLRALGEFMPFEDNSFDQVIFATSLDHFVDPEESLREANRVCKPDGKISIWIGEKDPNTPKPKVSPQWYQDLVLPEGAEDPFHVKRLFDSDVKCFFENCNLQIVKSEEHMVDEYRRNVFYQLRSK